MISLPDDVRQKLDEAETHQQEAWLNLNATIDGIEIRQMTLKDYFILQGLECPVLSGQEFTPVQLGIFLWILSPSFKACSKARDEFCKKVYGVHLPTAVKEVEDYLQATFVDADTASEEKKKTYTTFLAHQIDVYGREYGWTIDQTMNLPLRQIFQLNTAISERIAISNGEHYTKLREIDMIEAKAMLDQFRKNKNN
jgi:hypothetical protein